MIAATDLNVAAYAVDAAADAVRAVRAADDVDAVRAAYAVDAARAVDAVRAAGAARAAARADWDHAITALRGCVEYWQSSRPYRNRSYKPASV